jgi:glycosyltransferase involved in cell wall biosynthesis
VLILNALLNKKTKFAGTEQAFLDFTEAMLLQKNTTHTLIRPNAIFKEELQKLKPSQEFYVDITNIWNLKAIWKIVKIIRQIQPDIVMCHSGKTAQFLQFARFFTRYFPILGINHSYNPHKYKKTADYAGVINTYFQKVAKNERKKGTTFLIPNMIRIKKAEKFQIKKWHKPVVLGFLGRITNSKSPEAPIKALAILKKQGIDINLKIAGEGDSLNEMKNLVANLGIKNRVEFLGWIKDKKKYFDSIDIFCMPSTTESFGIVLLEAMKNSVPVITTNTWGPNDIFKNGTDGLIYNKDNAEQAPYELAKKIKFLAEDKKRADKLAQNAFDKVKNSYSVEAISKQLQNILEQIKRRK